jgi:hypothetical protein
MRETHSVQSEEGWDKGRKFLAEETGHAKDGR